MLFVSHSLLNGSLLLLSLLALGVCLYVPIRRKAKERGRVEQGRSHGGHEGKRVPLLVAGAGGRLKLEAAPCCARRRCGILIYQIVFHSLEAAH